MPAEVKKMKLNKMTMENVELFFFFFLFFSYFGIIFPSLIITRGETAVKSYLGVDNNDGELCYSVRYFSFIFLAFFLLLSFVPIEKERFCCARVTCEPQRNAVVFIIIR